MKKITISLAAIICCLFAGHAQTNWHITGNSGTTAGTNFVGTTDSVDLVFKTKNTERMRVKSASGGIRISNPTNDYVLYATKSGTGNGVYISNTSGTNSSSAIYGRNSGTGNGLYGYSAKGVGIYGYTAGTNTYGVDGWSSHAGLHGEGTSYGVVGYGAGTFGIGVWGSGINYGVYGYSADGTAINALTYATDKYALYVDGQNYRGLYCEAGTGWFSAYFNGDVYATGVFTSSDARLKKNIKQVDNAMDLINKLQPKYYEFRNDGSYASMKLPSGQHYGLLAQDVEKILPNLVKTEPFNTKDANKPKPVLNADGSMQAQKEPAGEIIETKSVNYTELIPILVKAMQELSVKNDEKDARIDELQRQLNELKGLNMQGRTAVVKGASLSQNIPNPFSGSSTINYTLPQQYNAARIMITDKSGKSLKEFNITGNGAGSITINASMLPAGAYQYVLYVDNKLVESKQMILTK